MHCFRRARHEFLMVHAYRLPCGFGTRRQGRLPLIPTAAIGVVLLTLVGAVGPALGEPLTHGGKADEVDTEHMFGFITGTDIGEVGDKELESETTGRLGKRTGSYTALSHMLGLEFTPLENDWRWARSRAIMTYPTCQNSTICVGAHSKVSPSK